MQENITQEYEKAMNYIYRLMKEGTLRIGSKLPTERFIAEELGIGRNSTREALSILHGMGLIESVQGSGNYVTKNVGHSMHQVILMMLALESVSQREVCEFRCVMENAVCNELIDKTLTDEEEDKIRAIVNQMDDLQGDDLIEVDKLFHKTLILATDNNLWIILMEAITEVYRDWIDYPLKQADDSYRKEIIQCHKDIVHFLLDKDTEKMKQAIDQHYDLIEKLLKLSNKVLY